MINKEKNLYYKQSDYKVSMWVRGVGRGWNGVGHYSDSTEPAV